MWQRRTVQLPTLWWLFAAFILSCGITHLVEATIFWQPWYRLSAFLKVITAVVSWATVIAIYKSLPGLSRLPLLAELNARLRRSEQDLLVTLNSIGDGVLTTDQNGRISRLNPIAEKLTGWSEAEAIGQPVEEIFKTIDEASGEPTETPVTRVLRTDGPVDPEPNILLVAQDGTKRSISDSAAAIRGSDGTVTGVILVFRDITAKIVAERHERHLIAKSIEFQSILLNLRDRVGQDREKFLPALTQRVAEALETSYCTVWLIDDDNIDMICADRFIAGTGAHESGDRFHLQDHPKFINELSRKGVFAVSDAENDSGIQELWGEYFRPQDVQSAISVPIRRNGSTVGIVWCKHAGSPRKWTRPEQDFLLGVATAIDISEENRERRAAVAEVERLNQDLEAAVIERSGDLAAQKELMARLLDNLTEGVVACDELGQLSFFNRAAREWHGKDVPRIPTPDLAAEFALFHPDGETPLAKEEIPLLRAFAGEQLRGVEIVIGRPDHDPRWVACNGVQLLGQNGEKLGALVAMRDITESRKAEAELRIAAERTRLATQAGQVGVWEMIVETGKVDWNDQMYVIYGINSDQKEIDYQTWVNSVHPDDLPAAEGALRTALQPGGKPFDQQFRVCRPVDGEIRYVRGVAQVFRDPNGQAIRVVGTNWDVTELRNRERALADALATQKELTRSAEAGERVKCEFLAVMSHEIRTPMNSVIGFAELLSHSQSLSTEDQETIATITKSGEALLRIIDDVLDFSRIGAGRLEFRLEEFSPDALVRDALEESSGVARAKSLELIRKTLPSVPEQITGDAGRTRQIVVNLISNAVKFTSTGSVTVETQLASHEDGHREIEFRVSDTGPGIPVEEQARVFEPFRQTDSGLDRNYGGTGLGLAISQRLAELMGGEITLQSDPDR